MNHRARLAALALLAATATACGASTHTGSSETTDTGAQIFTTAGCSGCHTLAAAHATGHVGPNLDDLKPSAATVRRQVTNGGAAMPAFKGNLTPQQINAVAGYVARVAGKGTP
jgi:mono/diheme cytochrome c family protein